MNIKLSKKLIPLLLSSTIALSSTSYPVMVAKASSDSSINQSSEMVKSDYIVTATTNVRIRNYPSLEGEQIGLLYKDKSLKFLGYDGEWAVVEYNDSVAYVHSDYVILSEDVKVDGNPMLLGYLIRDAKMSDLKNTKSYNVPRYELCEIYDEYDDSYIVKCENKYGLIKKRNVERLYGTVVVIDISSQNLTLYNGLSKVLSSNIVSGSDATPSDLGCFKLRAKMEGVYLKGDDYSVYVNYWMPYNGGEGMHDSTRGKFGGTIYRNNGSHGCINLPLSTAEKVYDRVKVGTKVLVKK